MRRILILALVVIAGVSCSQAVRWQKSGISAAEQQRDEADCTARASREASVPTAARVGSGTNPPYDPQQAQVQAYDVNVFAECMRSRGYEQVTPAAKP